MNNNKLARWLALLAGLSLMLALGGRWVARHVDERTRSGYLPAMAFSPDHSLAFVGSAAPGAVSVLALKDSRQVDQFVVDGRITAIVFHPDGSKVYVAAYASAGEGVDIHVIDSASRKELARFAAHGCAAGGMAIWPDGSMLTLSSEAEENVCIAQLDTRTGKSVVTLSTAAVALIHPGILAQDASRIYLPLCSGCYSPFSHYDPTVIVAGPRAYSIVVRPTDPALAPREIALPALEPSNLQPSVDNAKLAFIAADRHSGKAAVRLLDTASAALSAPLMPDAAGMMQVMGFSADSKTLFVAQSPTNTAPPALYLVDVATWRVAGSVPLQWTPDRVFGSPDGSKAYLLEYHSDARVCTRNCVGSVNVVDMASHRVVARVPLTGSFVHGLWEMAANSVRFLRNIGKPAD